MSNESLNSIVLLVRFSAYKLKIELDSKRKERVQDFKLFALWGWDSARKITTGLMNPGIPRILSNIQPPQVTIVLRKTSDTVLVI